MIGLIGIAFALLLGVGVRITAVSGTVMTLLMWSPSLPQSDDIFMVNDIIYALLLIGLALVGAGDTLAFGNWWRRTDLVRRRPWLT